VLLRPFKDDLSKTVPYLFYRVPSTNPDGPVTVFTDRFWDDIEHWLPPGVGVVPKSAKVYLGPIPPPTVGPLSGTLDEWQNGLLYSEYIANHYHNPNGCATVVRQRSGARLGDRSGYLVPSTSCATATPIALGTIYSFNVPAHTSHFFLIPVIGPGEYHLTILSDSSGLLIGQASSRCIPFGSWLSQVSVGCTSGFPVPFIGSSVIRFLEITGAPSTYSFLFDSGPCPPPPSTVRSGIRLGDRSYGTDHLPRSGFRLGDRSAGNDQVPRSGVRLGDRSAGNDQVPRSGVRLGDRSAGNDQVPRSGVRLGDRTSTPGTVLIDDHFVDVVGTHVDAHVIAPTNTVGATWSQVFGLDVIGIQGLNSAANAALPWVDPIGSHVGAMCVLNATVSDCTISNAQFFAASDQGIVFRFVDSLNLWFTAQFGATMYLVEVTAGVGTIRATQAVANDGTQKLSLAGNTIKFGSNALEGSFVSSVHAAATKYGLLQGFNLGSTWTFFKITT
jgi:hypothetical protein